MDNRKAQKSQIVEGVVDLLQRQGPPFPSYGQVADSCDLSRQLIKYYFDEPEDLMCEAGASLSHGFGQRRGHPKRPQTATIHF